jgi:hypothetical protein
MNQTTARTAGFLYLIVVVTGFFSLAYVPSQLIVQGDASATVRAIAGSELLFRVGIVTALICYTAFVLLPLVLYKLLSPVNRSAAVLMVVLALVSVPISFVNTLNRLDILSLLSGADYLQALTSDQLQAQVMLLLTSYGNGLLVLKVFWGLWLLPFGYLVFKSDFLPKILGILLMVGCFGYLIDFLGHTLALGYSDTTLGRFLRRPAALGEVSTCLWLLIMGVKQKAVSGDKA